MNECCQPQFCGVRGVVQIKEQKTKTAQDYRQLNEKSPSLSLLFSWAISSASVLSKSQIPEHWPLLCVMVHVPMSAVTRDCRYLLISLAFFGNCHAHFQDRPHLLWHQGYWQAELHRRKAHPSSKHSNLTTTKSFAKINSNQKGGKVFCRGPRCSWLSRARAMYTWVCASHAGKPPPLWSFAKLREQEEERQVSGHNLLLPGVY